MRLFFPLTPHLNTAVVWLAVVGGTEKLVRWGQATSIVVSLAPPLGLHGTDDAGTAASSLEARHTHDG